MELSPVQGGGSYALFIGNEGVNYTSEAIIENVICNGGINVYAHKATVNNSVIKGTKYYALWAAASAEITVNSGEYSSQGVNVLNSSADAIDKGINLKGGTFISQAADFENTLNKYLSEGYLLTKEGEDHWIVSKTLNSEE